jgi:hypothetical protein
MDLYKPLCQVDEGAHQSDEGGFYKKAHEEDMRDVLDKTPQPEEGEEEGVESLSYKGREGVALREALVGEACL